MEVKVQGSSIMFDNRFTVSFERTLRLPDDGKKYALPPTLGQFPLKQVADYKDKVPAAWREHGGVFIPLWQREALWLNFRNGQSWNPVALKVAAGMINAVSGKKWDQKLVDKKGDEQDYMVVPQQPWLDGFNTGKGIIRQFIAMPLGMGYTVEGQVTGKEEHGGMQVIVFNAKSGKFHAPTPGQFLPGGILRGHGGGQHTNSFGGGGVLYSSSVKSRGATLSADTSRGARMTSMDAGSEMGLAAGGKMEQKIYPDPHGVDTWDESSFGRLFVHIVNSQMYEAITGEPAPKSPVTAKSYTAEGLPWFQIYDEDKGDVKSSKVLEKVKSVAQKDKDHGFESQQDDTPVEVPASSIHKQPLLSANKLDGKW